MNYDLHYLIPEITVFTSYYGFFASSLFLKKHIYSTRYSLDEINWEMKVCDIVYFFANLMLASNLKDAIESRGYEAHALELNYFPFALVAFLISQNLWLYFSGKFESERPTSSK